MSVYKVSYVVLSGEHPGAIVNRDSAPLIGELVKLGEYIFEVIEVFELMPPKGNYHYYHATLKISSKETYIAI
jgi:hypothetical protein